MNILVATDGSLDPERAADAVGRWHSEGDSVTVFTAMNLPADFLRRLGDVGGVKGVAEIAREAGQTLGAGDKAAERLAPALPTTPVPRTDSPVLHALADAAISRTRPIVDAIKQRGIDAKGIWRTTEYRTARTIISTVRELDAGLLIVGSHGHGRFEGQLGSTGTKLVRHAPSAVLVLREHQGQ